MLKNRFFNLLMIMTLLSLFSAGCSLEQLLPVPLPSISEPPPSQSANTDVKPPEIRITSYVFKDTDSNQVIVRWIGTDDMTPSSQLVYSTFLKDYDRDYSSFSTDTTRTYNDLPLGTYTFYLKARDLENNIGLATTTVVITPPEPTSSGNNFVEPPVTKSLMILPNSEISQIAVSSYGSVVYALDSVNSKLYKSEHAGYGWKNISDSIIGTTPWTAFAISPVDHNIIAVVTNSGTEVYLSRDGGTSFSLTDLATKMSFGEKIKCISISPSYGNNNFEIAVGTSTNNGNGKIWIDIIGTFSGTWKDISTNTPGWISPSSEIAGVDVFAIKYSPSFASDGTLLAVTASRTSTNKGAAYLYMGIRDLVTNLITWNGLAGYPVEICEPGQNSVGTPLTYADIAIPSDFTSSIASKRNLYVCWANHLPGDSFISTGNIFRLEDSTFYQLKGQPDPICSLAYYGTVDQGKLLAGAMKSDLLPASSGVYVHFTHNPQSGNPSWERSQKPPTGRHNAQVGWAPDGNTAYCGTSTSGGASYDQSAFSRSTDNGINWNQIGLIDT